MASAADRSVDVSPAKEALRPLAGRSIQVVKDLSIEEQLYLYERTRRLKAKTGKDNFFGPDAGPSLVEVQDAGTELKLDDPDATVYLLFMEGSTRTKESFRNAAIFHGVKVNEFQAETSSFTKNETITDTIKMLSLYSTKRSVFVIRSPLEGVCRWLETVIPNHTARFGIPGSAFINAGDGVYAHPMLELNDTFSFLEHLRWDRSSIHLALVGDLAHGRSAHSKVDGLLLFGRVRVDLVAPSVLAYPVEYKNQMRAQGFDVREFDSIQEYLDSAADSLASIWYYYKPQFKKGGDAVQGSAAELRSKVTFKAEWEERLPEGVMFAQTLPRDKENPLIPLAFDSLPLNSWDRVASNAYFLEIVLLGMVFGNIGGGLSGPMERKRTKMIGRSKEEEDKSDEALGRQYTPFSGGPFALEQGRAPLPEFIEAVDVPAGEEGRRPERALSGGVVPLENGLVVDHIGISANPASVWKTMQRVRTIVGWTRYLGSEGVYTSSRSGGGGASKGIMSLPSFNFETLTVPQIKMLASVSPGCTVNLIKDSRVLRKYRLRVPLRLYNLPNIRCKNGLCVSNPGNRQRDVVGFFQRVPFYETSALPHLKSADYLLVCKYCQWPHEYKDIWADDAMHQKLAMHV